MRTRCWLFFKLSPLSTIPCQQRQVFSGGFHGDLEAVFFHFHLSKRRVTDSGGRESPWFAEDFVKLAVVPPSGVSGIKFNTTRFPDSARTIPVPGRVLVRQECSLRGSVSRTTLITCPPTPSPCTMALAFPWLWSLLKNNRFQIPSSFSITGYNIQKWPRD